MNDDMSFVALPCTFSIMWLSSGEDSIAYSLSKDEQNWYIIVIDALYKDPKYWNVHLDSIIDFWLCEYVLCI